jgi:hypothetical protein
LQEGHSYAMPRLIPQWRDPGDLVHRRPAAKTDKRKATGSMRRRCVSWTSRTRWPSWDCSSEGGPRSYARGCRAEDHRAGKSRRAQSRAIVRRRAEGVWPRHGHRRLRCVHASLRAACQRWGVSCGSSGRFAPASCYTGDNSPSCAARSYPSAWCLIRYSG